MDVETIQYGMCNRCIVQHMESLTAAIAIVGCLLILIFKPVGGLIVYCIGTFAYPQYVTLQLVTLDFSISRILILVIFLQLVLRYHRLRQFKWNPIDTAFLAMWGFITIALFDNEPTAALLIRQSGAFFDVMLTYFSARLIIRSKDDFMRFLKGLLLTGLYLAVLGIYQSITWHNPMGFLRNYAAWDSIWAEGTRENLIRHGLYRADVTFGQYIGFGMFFAALSPLSLTLIKQKKGWPLYLIIPGFILLLLGLISSMSSGPLFSIFTALSFVAFYPYRRFWKLGLAGFIFLCIFIELYSNRHFYDVLTRFAFSGETAQYRIELYEEAFGGGMRGHWICGWGLAGLQPRYPNDPFNWKHKDMTSEYIGVLMRYGLMGLIPLLTLTVLYYKRLNLAYQLAQRRNDQWLIWCFTAALVGWSVGTLTVAQISQMVQLFSLLIGIACNMPGIIYVKNFHPIEKVTRYHQGEHL